MSYFNLFVSPLQDFVDKRKEMSKTSLNEYIKIDRDKSTFKSHRDFDSEIEMTFKHF